MRAHGGNRLRGHHIATAGAAALAAFGLVVGAPIVKVRGLWPPQFASRPGLARPIVDGGWGTAWDGFAQAPSHAQLEALGSLATAIGYLVAGCLIIALFSIALHTVSRLVRQWRALTIRSALGAGALDLLEHIARDQVWAALAGSASGAALGAAVLAILWHAWPALLTQPPAIPRAVAGAALGVAAPALLIALAAWPLLFWLQRRSSAVMDLHGANLTERGGLLLTQNVLAAVQLAGLLVVVYGGALLIRGSSLLDPARPVPYDDSARIRPLHVAAAGGAGARASVYAKLVAASRAGDTPLVAIATPGTWEGFGRQIGVTAFCGDCAPLGGINSPINATLVRASAVSPGALGLMAIPLVRGREFRPDDDAAGARVVVLSDIAAAALFPFADPLGRQVRVDGDPGRPYRVVGVVRPPVVGGLGAGWAPSNAYFALLQNPAPGVEIVARSGADARLAATGWPRAVAGVRVGRPTALSQRLRDASAPLAWFGAVAAALALAALAVAGSALVVVMGATVESRRTEIAIRQALGARRRHLWRWVGRRALALTMAGSLAGLSIARLLGFLLRRHVSGVEADDLLLLGALLAGFGVLALLASLLPARRAMRVEPAAAWSDIR